MVRSYLRHEPTQAFGLICSPAARATFASDGKTATVAGLEDILRWDVKTGQQIAMWHEIGHSSPVTAIAHSNQTNNKANNSNSDLYAVGYADGSIRVWDALSSTVRLTLNGHKSAITALQFDIDGLFLVSGSQDTNITLWDIVSENGLFRLKGHRDAITDLSFLRLPAANDQSENEREPSTSSNQLGYKSLLFSTSKDGLLKVWDLALQYCIETVLPGKGELWSLKVLPAEQIGASNGTALILVGNSDGKMKIFQANVAALLSTSKSINAKETQSHTVKLLTDHGQIDLVGGRRVSQIDFKLASGSSESRFIGVTASDKSVEIFRIRTQDDIRKKMARRRRRAKEKAEKKNGSTMTGVDEADALIAEPTWQDRLEAYTIIRPGRGKIKSFSFAEADQSQASSSSSNRGAIPILLAMANNSLEVFHLPTPKKNREDGETSTKEATLVAGLDLAGHRSEVRAIALSSDDSLLATADSAGSLKIWNAASGRMVRSLPCGYALSLVWLPDDQHVLVGCKDGTLKTYDVRSGIQLEDIPAHQGPIWSVTLHPDGQSCLTASGDKDVKFWEFESRSQDEEGEESEQEEQEDDEDTSRNASAILGLAHIRTLKMTDDVLCARFSPDGKLLALALLDSTVKVFYADSLKFFLSLYGHKLPVLSLDISGDSKLCVTVSADKNAKIWGLDFGDCHRSLFAHEESIMAVAFEKGDQGGGLMGGREGVSHRFWTCAKDGKLKYWDGDKFQCIQTMTGHHGDVTGLAVGSKGSLVVSAGMDRSIRVWEKTEEPLFLEEERERELEEMFEGGGQKERNDDERQYGSLAEGNENGNQGQMNGELNEVENVTKSTKETMLAGERLLEAIELAKAELEGLAEYERQKKTTGLHLAPPARNPIINHAFEPGEDVDVHAYVLKIVSKILPAQLDDALLVLPFDAVMRLMIHLNYWASKEWNMSLVARILFFLLRNYHGQIVSNRIMRTTLQTLRRHLRASLQRQKMTIGYNLAGLQFVKSRLMEKRTDDMYMREGFDLDEETVKQRLEQSVARKRKMIA